MNLNELIENLEISKNKYGNLEVVICNSFITSKVQCPIVMITTLFDERLGKQKALKIIIHCGNPAEE